MQTAEQQKDLHSWVNRYLKKAHPQFQPVSFTNVNDMVGFDGSHLILNASDLGLNNVYDVSVFIRKLFGKCKDRDFSRDALPPLKKRIRKAAAIILRGV